MVIANKIPFGKRNNRLLDVSEVERGTACGCVCPGCEKPLLARKGELNTHHFAHSQSDDAEVCSYGLETAIHDMAKQILVEEAAAHLPEAKVTRSAEDLAGGKHEVSNLRCRPGLVPFDSVTTEVSIDRYRVDIVGTSGGRDVLVEIAVTHFCEDEKIAYARRIEVDLLEIDLSSLAKGIPSKDEIRSLLLDQEDNRRWLSISQYRETVKELEAELEGKVSAANAAYRERKQRSQPAMRSSVSRAPISPPVSGDGASHITYSKNDVRARRFLCEPCYSLVQAGKFGIGEAIFTLDWNDAPAGTGTVKCPRCDYDVPANGPFVALSE